MRRFAGGGKGAEAAGAFAIGMENDAEAGDGFIGFRQAHRDVVGDEAGGVGDAHEVGRLDVEAVADVGRADFYELDCVELRSLCRGR